MTLTFLENTLQKPRGITGAKLNSEWNVGAKHALYHHEGIWYHPLRRFPGALFDYNGYVLFPTRESYEHCADLRFTQDVKVPAGISHLRGYRPMR